VIINLSTVGVDSIRALATAAAESGIDVVDAPATGAADGARAATLTLIGRFQGQLGVGSDLAAAAADRFERALERYGPTRGELAVARLAETAMDVSIRATR
jgi:3-hydroxyisobutyrate dehydrogenase-like beta-hydroxyacid dehydrogenase